MDCYCVLFCTLYLAIIVIIVIDILACNNRMTVRYLDIAQHVLLVTVVWLF